MEEKNLNIYAKLLAITNELTKVAKNLQVGEGKYAYKAVGEADILAAVRPLEDKYKVYSYPAKRQVIETGEIETKTGSKNVFLRIETTYRFVNTEEPTQYIEITSYGDGVDSQDKAPGKAMTYADKYALMKAYKIMTGDDPDQYMSEELKAKTTYKGQNKASGGVLEQTEPTNSANIKMSLKQQIYIKSLDQKLQDFAVKKYALKSIDDLSYEQAEYIINSIKSKRGE